MVERFSPFTKSPEDLVNDLLNPNGRQSLETPALPGNPFAPRQTGVGSPAPTAAAGAVMPSGPAAANGRPEGFRFNPLTGAPLPGLSDTLPESVTTPAPPPAPTPIERPPEQPEPQVTDQPLIVNVPGRERPVRFPAGMTMQQIEIAIREENPDLQQGDIDTIVQGLAQGVAQAGGTAAKGLAANYEGFMTAMRNTARRNMDARQRIELAFEYMKDASEAGDRETAQRIGDDIMKMADDNLDDGPQKLTVTRNMLKALRGDFSDMQELIGETEPGVPLGRIDKFQPNIRENRLFQAGERIQQGSEKAFPIDPERRDEFVTQLAQAVGSTGTMLGTALLHPGAGLATAMAMGSGEAAENALQKAETEEQVQLAAALGMGPGAIDFLPIANLLRPASRIPGAKPYLMRVARKAVEQGAVEGTTEGVQQFVQNLIQKINTDPDVAIAAGVPESVALGAATGGIFGTGAGIVSPGAPAARETPPPAPAPERREPTVSPPGEPEIAPDEAVTQPEVAPAAIPGEEPVSQPADEPLPPRGSPADIERVMDDPRPLEEIRAEDEARVTQEREAEVAAAVEEAGALPVEQRVEVVFPDGGTERLQVGAYEIGEGGLEVTLTDLDSGEIVFRGPYSDVAMRPTEGEGTKESPVRAETPSDVRAAAERVEQPSPAQAEANNYRQGHLKWRDLDLAIETPQGGTRTGIGEDGQTWSSVMPFDYGRIKGIDGADGDKLDFYMGPATESDRVFVIDQVDPETGAFDEHKVMLGFPSVERAMRAYGEAFGDGSAPVRAGALTEMSYPEFRTWAQGDLGQPADPAAVADLESRRAVLRQRRERAEAQDGGTVDVGVDQLGGPGVAAAGAQPVIRGATGQPAAQPPAQGQPSPAAGLPAGGDVRAQPGPAPADPEVSPAGRGRDSGRDGDVDARRPPDRPQPDRAGRTGRSSEGGAVPADIPARPGDGGQAAPRDAGGVARRGEPASPARADTEQPVEPALPGFLQRTEARPAPKPATASTPAAILYRPVSKARSSNHVVPSQQAEGVIGSMFELEGRNGAVDEYVAARLGDDPSMTAEQVDATGLAMNGIEAGHGVIIGDDPAVDPGKAVAAMARYARRRGKTPVILAAEPEMYRRIWEDLRAVGERDINPLVFGRTLTGRDAIKVKDGRIAAPPAKAQRDALQAMAERGEMGEYDVIFASYGDFAGPNGAESRAALRGIAPESLIIFDEAHAAGGVGDEAAQDALRALTEATSNAWGAVYASPDFANDPMAMGVYSRAGVTAAIPDEATLSRVVEEGGQPLADAMAEMMARDGRYIRRQPQGDLSAEADVQDIRAKTVSSTPILDQSPEGGPFGGAVFIEEMEGGRKIVTGNILAARARFGKQGEIVRFTDDQGVVRTGILMPEGFDPAKGSRFLRGTLEAEQVIEREEAVTGADGVVRFGKAEKAGHVEMRIRKDGGQRFIDSEELASVLGSAGKDAALKAGDTEVTATVPFSHLSQALDVFREMGVGFSTSAAAVENLRNITESDPQVAPKQSSLGPRRLRPRFAAESADIREQILRIARRSNRQVNVRFVDQLFASGETAKRSGALTGAPIEAAGQYDRLERLITISLDPKFDAVETAFHEIWHSVEALLDARERRMIRNAFPGNEYMTAAEEAAYHFGEWAAGRYEAPSNRMKRAFDKILSFLKRVGNMLRGRGFHTYEDVFASVFDGEVGARTATPNNPYLADMGAEGQEMIDELVELGMSRANAMQTTVAEADYILREPQAFSLGERPRARGNELVEEIGSRIMVDGDARRSLPTRMRERFRQLSYDDVMQGVFDGFHAIKKLELAANDGALMDGMMSAWKSALRTQNLSGVMVAIMKRGALRYDAKEGTFMLNKSTKGLEDIFKPLTEHRDGDLVHLWKLWAIGQRARRLHGEGREALIPAVAKEMKVSVDEVFGALDALGEKYPVFKRVMDDWTTFNKATLDMAQDAGLIDPASREIWEKNDYVPFYRALEASGAGGQRGVMKKSQMAKIANQKNGIYELKGGEEMINDVIDNMIMNVAYLVDGSFKNVAAQRTMHLALEAGAAEKVAAMKGQKAIVPAEAARRALMNIGVDIEKLTPAQRRKMVETFQLVPPRDGDVVSVMQDGKSVYYRINDPLLLRAMVAMHPKNMHALVQVMSGAKRLLTHTVTADPGFMLRNMMRDTLQAKIVSGEKFGFGYSTLKGFVDSARLDDDLIEILAAGAGSGGFYSSSFENFHKHLRGLNKADRAMILDAPGKMWEGWQQIGYASENANRLAIYRSMRKKGASVAEAAHEAQDLLNFSMHGDYEPIRFIAQTVPFFNARVQGLYRLGRGFVDPNVARGKVAKMKLPNGTELTINLGVLARGLILMGASMAYWYAVHDDERYQDLEEWDKDTYWHAWVGDDDLHLRIPKPFEVGAIFSTIPERALSAMFVEDEGKYLAPAMGRMVNDTFAMNPIPQLFKPVVEQYANRSFFFGRPIVSPSVERGAPEAQFLPSTSEFARELADMMPDAAPEPLRSPQRLEHLIQGYFGTMGRYAMGAADSVTRYATDAPSLPTRSIGEVPVVGGFVKSGEPTSSRWMTEFYDLHGEVQGLYLAVRHYQKMGEIDKAREVAQENAAMLGMRKPLENIAQRLSNTRKAIRAIQTNRDMSPDEKRANIDTLRGQMLQAAKQTRSIMQRIDEIQEAQP